jgi:molybdopterin converting factor small subunit
LSGPLQEIASGQGEDPVTPYATSAHRPADTGTSAGGPPDDGPQVTVLFFAAARVAAGTNRTRLNGRVLADVLDQARSQFGPAFADVLDTAQVWVNGDPVPPDHPLHEEDEVAVLPPVSGGVGPCR